MVHVMSGLVERCCCCPACHLGTGAGTGTSLTMAWFFDSAGREGGHLIIPWIVRNLMVSSKSHWTRFSIILPEFSLFEDCSSWKNWRAKVEQHPFFGEQNIAWSKIAWQKEMHTDDILILINPSTSITSSPPSLEIIHLQVISKSTGFRPSGPAAGFEMASLFQVRGWLKMANGMVLLELLLEIPRPTSWYG